MDPEDLTSQKSLRVLLMHRFGVVAHQGVVNSAGMPLSDQEIKGLKTDAKRKVVSVEDSLLLVVGSVGKDGGKSFIGRLRSAHLLADRASR